MNVVPHTFIVHAGCWQSVVSPGQSLPVRQPTQLPLPSHSDVPLPQLVPGASSENPAEPFVQVPVVHAVLAGVLLLSIASWTPPEPLHCACRQSPAVWLVSGVPCAVKSKPHTPAVHVRVSHWVSLPGQSVGNTQLTQSPLPSHSVAEPLPHAVPSGCGGFDGTPSVHTACKHWFCVVGRLLLLTTVSVPPEPLQTTASQSPMVWLDSGVPSAVKSKPHVPALHSTVWHWVLLPGHSLAAMQPMHFPAPLQTRP